MHSLEIRSHRILRQRAFKALYAFYRAEASPYRPDPKTVQYAFDQLRVHADKDKLTFRVFFPSRIEIDIIVRSLQPIRLLPKAILKEVMVKKTEVV